VYSNECVYVGVLVSLGEEEEDGCRGSQVDVAGRYCMSMRVSEV
jgi:hypothetical protein